MKILIIALLFLVWHFSTTAFVPTEAGKANFFWTFATDAKSLLPSLVVLPKQAGSPVTAIVAGIASLGFIVAGLSLFGLWVPAGWWAPAVLVAASTSVALFVLYFGVWALVPIAVDIILLWGVLSQHWSAAIFKAA